jgi:hypothetical protein
MTMTVWETRPLYAAITAQLETTTKAVGQAISPGGETPYMVLFPLPDESHGGSLTDPHQFVTQLFQVTCVGKTMEEAEWMQHEARTALVGFTPAVDDATPIELDLGSGVRRDDDGPVFFTTDRFRITF